MLIMLTVATDTSMTFIVFTLFMHPQTFKAIIGNLALLSL